MKGSGLVLVARHEASVAVEAIEIECWHSGWTPDQGLGSRYPAACATSRAQGYTRLPTGRAPIGERALHFWFSKYRFLNPRDRLATFPGGLVAKTCVRVSAEGGHVRRVR